MKVRAEAGGWCWDIFLYDVSTIGGFGCLRCDLSVKQQDPGIYMSLPCRHCSTRLSGHCPIPDFSHGCWGDPHSYLHACSVSTLPTETSHITYHTWVMLLNNRLSFYLLTVTIRIEYVGNEKCFLDQCQGQVFPQMLSKTVHSIRIKMLNFMLSILLWSSDWAKQCKRSHWLDLQEFVVKCMHHSSRRGKKHKSTLAETKGILWMLSGFLSHQVLVLTGSCNC